MSKVSVSKGDEEESGRVFSFEHLQLSRRIIVEDVRGGQIPIPKHRTAKGVKAAHSVEVWSGGRKAKSW